MKSQLARCLPDFGVKFKPLVLRAFLRVSEELYVALSVRSFFNCFFFIQMQCSVVQ